MKILLNLVLIFFLFQIVSNSAFSEEKVNFKDDETAKKLLFNKKWLCSLGDPMYSGYSTWTFEEINNKKVSGTIEREYCGGGHTAGTQKGGSTPSPFKGKLKKDTFKFSVPEQGINCTRFSGNMEFYYLDGTDIQSQGKYTRYSHGNETFRGTVLCYVQE